MKKFNIQICAFLICAFGFLAGAQRACAQGQATLSIQGVLQNFNGSAVDNGQYDITFKLYTTDAGGTALWTETQTVTLTGGVYSVLLGAVNPLNVPFDQPYYIGLTIPGGPEHTPRTRLTASPYALSLLGQDNKFPSTGMVEMGSVATGTDITTATSYTVGANDHVIYLDHTANQNVTLPAASSANKGRQLLLVNKEAVAKTLTASNYVDLAGGTSTTIPATGVVELQSDGSVWRQTGGYVQPAVSVGKAFVRLQKTQQTIPLVSLPSLTVLSFTEVSDDQNCWNTTTHTFTAPRTGIYVISGSMIYEQSSVISYIVLNDFSQPLIAPFQADTQEPYSFSFPYPMTAGQTFQLKVVSQNGQVILDGGNGGYATFLTVLEQ